ncbi:MFS transporter [Streptococcus iniae]|nr:MFS transporter [Streptococcus iniae]
MMHKNEGKLLASVGISKIGNVMYDYGNSTWLAGLGILGQKYIGYYQLAENVISLLLNPIGGAVADRFKRRKILLVTDLIASIMCLTLGLFGTKDIMLWGLIVVNGVLAVLHAFSGTSFRSYVANLVEEDRLVAFNAHLEMLSQIVSVSSPILAFLFVDRFGLKPTLISDGISFMVSFLILLSLKAPEGHVTENKQRVTVKEIFMDIIEGLKFVSTEKEIFFLLIIASLVNFFIAAYNYLIPFTNQLFSNQSSYASLLTAGALGAILGAFLSSKVFKNTYKSLLLSLALSGLGLTLLTVFATLGLPIIVILLGNLIFSLFLTIFNIHFFTLVSKKVPAELLGRVFSSIYTVAIVFMPLGTFLMTVLPSSVDRRSFLVNGLAITVLSAFAYSYAVKNFK